MSRFTLIVRALLTLYIAGLVPGIVLAQDADTREIQSYVLTESGLSKYAKASRALSALPGASCDDDDDDDDDDSDSKSIADMVAKIDATPAARTAIESAGMTTREYVTFSLSLLQNGLAAWAVSQPGGKLPDGVSKANVDFFNQHKAELEQLEALRTDDACSE